MARIKFGHEDINKIIEEALNPPVATGFPDVGGLLGSPFKTKEVDEEAEKAKEFFRRQQEP